MSVEHEIFHSIPGRIDDIEAIVSRIEQKLDASNINRDMLAALKLVDGWIKSRGFIPTVDGIRLEGAPIIGPETREVFQAVETAIARAEAHEGQRNNG